MNGRDRFDRVYKKSVEYLDSVSALELMRDAEALDRDIDRVIVRYRLPGTLIIGILMTKIQNMLKESEFLSTEKAIMGLTDVVKKYMDENFIKKEKLQ